MDRGAACIAERSKCTFELPSRDCGSMCTLGTCPSNSTCSDDRQTRQPVCTCDEGFRAVDADPSDETLGRVCKPVSQGNTVGNACRDYGYTADPLFGTPEFDAERSCQEWFGRNGMLCLDREMGGVAQRRCPKTCHDQCAAQGESCGCVSQDPPPCGDFYAIDANCPVHGIGRFLPETCDGKKLHLPACGQCIAAHSRVAAQTRATLSTTSAPLCSRRGTIAAGNRKSQRWRRSWGGTGRSSTASTSCAPGVGMSAHRPHRGTEPALSCRCVCWHGERRFPNSGHALRNV